MTETKRIAHYAPIHIVPCTRARAHMHTRNHTHARTHAGACTKSYMSTEHRGEGVMDD